MTRSLGWRRPISDQPSDRRNCKEIFRILAPLTKLLAPQTALLSGVISFEWDECFRTDCGDLFVTGRVDDMIISGGEKVSPGDIESVLSLHPAVAEVAVAGLPDVRWGQRVTAFVKRAAAPARPVRSSVLPLF